MQTERSEQARAETAALRFFVRGRPRSKGSPSIMRNARTGRPFVRESPAEKSWEAAIKVLAQLAMRRRRLSPFEGPVAVRLEFLLPAPARKRRDGRERAAWLSPTIDIDKAARAALDAIARVAYADDRQVVELVASKRLAGEDEPGVWISVGRVTA